MRTAGAQQPAVLVVDDESLNVELVERALRKEFRTLGLTSAHAALEHMRSHPDLAVIISDQRMPEMTGVDLLQKSLELVPLARRVILTAYSEVQDIVRAVNIAKVDRFLSKPFSPDELLMVTRSEAEHHVLLCDKDRLLKELAQKNELLEEHEKHLDKVITQRTRDLESTNARLGLANEELVRLNQQLLQQATLDGLTGLHNHRSFQERLSDSFQRAKRFGRPLSLLFLDMDQFKSYNDQNGHQAGDALLQQVARLLVNYDGPSGVRTTDLVARYGGEEFAIILAETELAGAVEKAKRICKAIASHPFPYRERQPLGFVSVSIGVATFKANQADPSVLVEQADKALYRAKEEGRNRVKTFEEL